MKFSRFYIHQLLGFSVWPVNGDIRFYTAANPNNAGFVVTGKVPFHWIENGHCF
jgi:hypothetical protein